MRLDHLLSKGKEVGIVLLLSIQRKQETAEMDMNLLVAMRLGVTPVPIPNTMVKTQAADGTLLETARESRWLPVCMKAMSRAWTAEDCVCACTDTQRFRRTYRAKPMTEMKRSGIEVGTVNLYILYRRTWLRGSTSGTEREI